MRKLVLLLTHIIAVAIGFAIGVYALPILVAPSAPSSDAISRLANEAIFKGRFRRDLEDSDALHWGEGEVSVSSTAIALNGELAPGPDYKLYLSPQFVETEVEFNRLKPDLVRVGDVKTFKNFVVPIPPTVDVERFNTVVVWCESFGQFITAAQYK
jgi:hypothetical protein